MFGVSGLHLTFRWMALNLIDNLLSKSSGELTISVHHYHTPTTKACVKTVTLIRVLLYVVYLASLFQ
jgi:hypothetical protein